jgi:hypothetical protein
MQQAERNHGDAATRLAGDIEAHSAVAQSVVAVEAHAGQLGMCCLLDKNALRSAGPPNVHMSCGADSAVWSIVQES